jgi:hypothetical protein
MPRLEQRIRALEEEKRARADVSCPQCHGIGGLCPIPIVEIFRGEKGPASLDCPTCGKPPPKGGVAIIEIHCQSREDDDVSDIRDTVR